MGALVEGARLLGLTRYREPHMLIICGVASFEVKNIPAVCVWF